MTEDKGSRFRFDEATNTYVRVDDARPAESAPNPNWREPEDGEVVGAILTLDGAFKEVYCKATKSIRLEPLTFDEVYGSDDELDTPP